MHCTIEGIGPNNTRKPHHGGSQICDCSPHPCQSNGHHHPTIVNGTITGWTENPRHLELELKAAPVSAPPLPSLPEWIEAFFEWTYDADGAGSVVKQLVSSKKPTIPKPKVQKPPKVPKPKVPKPPNVSKPPKVPKPRKVPKPPRGKQNERPNQSADGAAADADPAIGVGSDPNAATVSAVGDNVPSADTRAPAVEVFECPFGKRSDASSDCTGQFSKKMDYREHLTVCSAIAGV